MTQGKLDAGLECYDPEGRLFPTLARTGGQIRELSKRDILLILKWKLGRIKEANLNTIRDDVVYKINDAVAKAEVSGAEAKALDDLANLPGIGLATATAILTVCYPDRFTIIDERVLGILLLFPPNLPDHKRKRYSTVDWCSEDYLSTYLPAVKGWAERWGCSLRDADRALWGLSVNRQIDGFIERSGQPSASAEG